MRVQRRLSGIAVLAVILLSPPLVSLAFTGPVEHTRLVAEWNRARIEISPFDTFDVYLKLRIEHGDDDFWIEDGPHRVTSDETTPLDIPWPDLSYKGELIAAPAIVSGTIQVFSVAGDELGPVPIETRLWFADVPDDTLPEDALASLTALVVEEGVALAGISPEAFVAAGVTP